MEAIKKRVIKEVKDLANKNLHGWAMWEVAIFYNKEGLGNRLCILNRKHEEAGHLTEELRLGRSEILSELKKEDIEGLCQYL